VWALEVLRRGQLVFQEKEKIRAEVIGVKKGIEKRAKIYGSGGSLSPKVRGIGPRGELMESQEGVVKTLRQRMGRPA